MKLTEAQLKEIWQGQTARATPQQAECLSEDQFVRAVTGETSRQKRAKMASHLAVCSDCLEKYRILRSLRPMADQVEARLAAPAAPGIRQNLRAVEREAAQPAALRTRFAAPVSPARAAIALAAILLISLAFGLWFILPHRRDDQEIARLKRELAERDQSLASVSKSLDETRRRLEETARRSKQRKTKILGTGENTGLSAIGAVVNPTDPSKSSSTEGVAGADSKQHEDELAQLRRTITELSTPQIDAPIVDLDPSSPTRGITSGGVTKIEPPPTANFFTLILNITGQRQDSTYSVEIFDSNGKQVWRGQRLRLGPEYKVNLTLARRLFPAGRYLIKLYGLRDGKQEPVADYPVLINYQ
jgi:hypothetical protein